MKVKQRAIECGESNTVPASSKGRERFGRWRKHRAEMSPR